jgi:cell division protein ZapA (FtsZ GTPase activity inhibitor)
VAVEIAGEKHVLRSDVPPEYTRQVAAHVDATIRALPGFQQLEPFRAATLAALSITDELFRAREEIRRLQGDQEYRTNILADQLETAVAAAAEKRPVRRPGGLPASVSWTAEPAPAGAAPPLAADDSERSVLEVQLEPVGPPPLPSPGPAWREDARPAETPPPLSEAEADERELRLPPPE